MHLVDPSHLAYHVVSTDASPIFVQQCRMSILDTLTPDDLRILTEAEDEFSRCGGFERVFPSPTASKYMRFFDNPRYYNILLDEWIRKYHRQHAKGESVKNLKVYSFQVSLFEARVSYL